MNAATISGIITHTGGKYDDRKVFQWLNTVFGRVRKALHGTYPAILPNFAIASIAGSNCTPWFIGWLMRHCEPCRSLSEC